MLIKLLSVIENDTGALLDKYEYLLCAVIFKVTISYQCIYLAFTYWINYSFMYVVLLFVTEKYSVLENTGYMH